MTLVDDYSRRVWVYFLKNKNEASSKFKEWKLLVENKTGKKIKRLRTDNGLEYCNKEFNDFCAKHGITRLRTCIESPQQNEIVECMNRTILEKVRCLLNESSLSKRFWAQATNTTLYLINRSPSSALNFKTPMHVWSGLKPNLSHLRLFGCIAYVLINQGKLNLRAVKGIFIGYATGVKGYKVWLLNEKKRIISRNIVFHENATTNTDMQEANKPPKAEYLQFEVEHPTGHPSQDQLDETSDQGDTSSKSHKSTSDTKPNASRSPARSVNSSPIRQTIFSEQADSRQSMDTHFESENTEEGGDLSGY